ncbi:MAG: Gfo/Idh/MocA family oxidoreductase [Okeania sp. SIO3I5]|uniref:Gfo/Idh/MocA family oxidoreductase n=1 Tax=Okeania sp. SIO3I5 TaxID=2607805 RepID=UPI0013B89229|nr:Gfo/Idh/MocA family oxidoreductase [Okeania sp. SIO3I5]NEQ35140.1 Gfo/Idh/MocA family oxidoreductase [Okeania sp. SIO3I5]
MTNTLRFGIVGTGFIARVIAEALVDAKNCALVGVASRSISRAQEFGQQFGVINSLT